MNSGCQATLPNIYVNTGMEVITTAGSSFTLFMQAATSASGCSNQYPQGFAVWADWNNNGNLTDPGELLMTFPSSFYLNSGTVTVPANQPPGRYRLRIRCTYAVIPSDPCSLASYGETEDYVIAVVGPPPTLTYSWTGPNGFTANTEDISGLVAGTYNLTITGAGQPIQYTVTITQPPAVAAPSASDVNICPGQSATLTASGSTGQYNWYSDAQGTNLVGTGASITLPNVTQSSTYYVQAVSGNCTSALTPVQILINPSPTVSITGDNTVCLGATFTLDGSGSSVQAPSVINQYAWDFNSDGTVDFTSASPTASHSVNLAGTYTATLTVTATGGCTGNGTFNYVVPNDPTADFTWPTDICSATIQLDASASSVASPQTLTGYGWDFDNNGTVDQNTAQPTVTHTFPGAGNHTVTLTVTSSEGCTGQVTHTLNIPNTLTVQITGSTDISCFGASDGSATALASGGSGNYSYSWSTTPAQTTATATGLAAGYYTVTVTDAASCTATASVTINSAAPLDVTISNVQPVSCFGGSNGQATAQVTGGTAPLSYSWNTTPAQNTATVTNLAAGTWTVTVTDGNNCTGAASVQISEPQALVVQASSVNISCFGQNNGQLSAAANGGTGAINYSWNTVPPANSQTVNNVPAGNYTVTVTDQNGCTATAQASVTQPPQIVLQTNHTNVSCPGGSNGSATVQGSGGTGALSFAWNTLPPATGTSVSNLAAGTYTVIATDQNGCQASATVTITELSVPMQHTAQVTNVTCGGLSNGAVDFTLTQGTGPYQYSWSNGATTEDISGVPGGTYTVNVTDANGCPYSATFVVNENPVLQLSTTVTPILCYGDQTGNIKVQVQGGTPPYSYAWNGQPGTSEFSNLGAGTYAIVVTDANNCQASTQATIPAPAQIVISHTPEYEIFMGQGVDLVTLPSGGTGSLFISWDPEVYLSCSTCNVPYASPVRDTRYTITAQDNNGCKASADIWVRVIKVGPFIPTAFTPTGDNKNEVFRVVDYGVTETDIRIFDRWGNEVYQSQDLYEGWDGTIGGKKAEQGTYIYRIVTTYIDGKTKVYTGLVTLVR